MANVYRIGKFAGGFDFIPDTAIIASEVNADFNSLYGLVNGQIDNANIKDLAEIAGSKLQIDSYIKDEHIAGDANLDGIKFKPLSVRVSEMAENAATTRYTATSSTETTHTHLEADKNGESGWTEIGDLTVAAVVTNANSSITCTFNGAMKLDSAGTITTGDLVVVRLKFTWNTGGSNTDGNIGAVETGQIVQHRGAGLSFCDILPASTAATYNIKVWVQTAAIWGDAGNFVSTIPPSAWSPNPSILTATVHSC